MSIISSLQALKAMNALRIGKTAKLSIAQVTNLIINLPDAQKNLSQQDFTDVYALYCSLQKCRTKHVVDMDGYYKLAIDIIRKFDKIAPYEKYSGGNELEFSFLMNELRQNSDGLTTDRNTEDFLISFRKLGIDIQTVLLSNPMDSKQLAETVANLLADKYSVTATANESHFDVGKYQIWLYRIPLNLIAKNYDPESGCYLFRLSDLQSMPPAVNADEIIRSASPGCTLPLTFDVEFSRTPNAYRFLCEDSHYKFYCYFGGHLLRVSKTNSSIFFLGKYVHIDFCVSLHGRLFFSETKGIIGDREIYSCSLDGSNVLPLHCLNNEKVFIAGHAQSIDKVTAMTVDGDYAVVDVCRRDPSGTFDYKLFITCLNGEVIIGKRN